MSGPGIAWYLGVAAFLFGIGALGVLIRRNPLIVLLSLEIMLNAGEPRADRVLAPRGERRRPDLRARRDGGRRRRRSCVGLGLVVAIHRRASRSTSTALGAARMIAGAWLCLLAPLAARS